MKMTRWGKRALSLAAAAVLALGCVLIPLPATQAQPEETLPYMDITRSFEERAADLVSRMTLEQKIAHLGNRSTTAVPELGVVRYDFWTEGLHGVARLGKATSFPYSIAMAATWDPALIERITTAVSDEARAYDNRGVDGFKRLVYWSPTINMARDPRWGRNHESYGEDPFLTTQIGSAFVTGMQGHDEKYYKVISTIKHYAANNSEYNRHTGDSQMDDRTLREYYTRAFKGIVRQTNVGGAMSSYNRVNGVPASASVYLLDTLLRRTFGFDGYVTSDCGAIQDITEQHKWVPEGFDRVVTKEESVYFGLLAGCDIDCGSIYPNYAMNAVKTGVLSEDLIDLALLNSFTARMRTGEFDPDELVVYRSDDYSFVNQVESDAHKQLAEDSANDAIVLLKNDGVLPLDLTTKKNVVMIGEVADKVDLSNYSGSPSEENMSTPIQGMTAMGANVTYIKGGTSATGTGSYLCNLKNITINKADGKSVVLTPKQALQLNGCRYEENSGNIGYIEAGATLMFKDVDIKDAVSVSFQLAGDNSVPPAAVTMTMDSVNGMQVAQVSNVKTGGWQTYQTVTSEVGDLGGYEKKDLYVTFKLELQDVTFSAADTQAIQNADAVIVCLEGNGSGEGTDRSTIAMPAYQTSLAKTVATLNDNVIVYIQSVGVVEIEDFKDDVDAILWTSFNGQAQGNAMARVISGAVNPSAKMPETWYARNSELATINDYNIRGEDGFPGWSYQYYTGPVTYPFGYGLSYSTFEYSNLQIDKTTVTPDDVLTATVDVKNTSAVDGKEIVELYVAVPDNDGVERPFKQLKAFDKVAIAAGQTEKVTLKLDLSDCYFWDEEAGRNVYDQGQYTLFVGPSSDEATALKTTFTMDGELTPAIAVVTATAPGIK
ncbi:MAG: glycoside hydrolase family 3 C-terminal domain-containing protein, partial [Acutalibacteraceae bacterium]